MSTTTSTTLSNTYQGYFSKKLLGYAEQLLRLNEYAAQDDLPKNVGSKTISFFRPSAPTTANVQTLTEGTPISSFGDVTYTKVDFTLTQIGEASKITDIVGMTSLFNALKQNIETMGGNCALYADEKSRNALNAQTTGLSIRRANAAATWTALNSDTATSFGSMADVLDARTQLVINRAPSWNGDYVAIVPPQISRDLMRDTDWVEASKYSAIKQLFRGEIGSFYGVRIIEATNPFVAKGSGTAGDEYTYDLTGGAGIGTGADIYTTMVLGKGAFGVSKLTGTASPWKPQIVIVDKPDKSDPLNQTVIAGWKAFYAAGVLNTAWGIAYKSKSRFQ